MTGLGTQMAREDLLDALADLQHDLGKYLVMPVAFLPADAGTEALRGALRQALFETRQGDAAVRTAREMWHRFIDEVGSGLDGLPSMRLLVGCVEQALGWEGRLDDVALDRQTVHRDFAAVGDAIRLLIEEVHDAR